MADTAFARFFPAVGDLMNRAGWRRDTGYGGSAFLQLANSSISPLKRWSGRLLAQAERVVMVLRIYREALESELEGRFARADFCWRRLIKALAAAGDDAWAAASATAQHDFAMTPRHGFEIRDAFVREVVTDTFTALFSIYSRSDAADAVAREATYRAYAASVLDLFKMPNDVLVAMLAIEFQKWTSAKDWKRATEAAAELVRRVPDDIEYEDTLVFAIQAGAIAGMSNDGSEAAARKNAGLLRRTIDELQKLRKQHPVNSTIYNALSSVHHIYAIQLANSGAVANALVEAERAAAYNPDEEKINETRESLKQLMTQRQQAVQELLARVAATPNARLSASGHAMRADATKGFRPLRVFTESSEPQAIATAAATGRAEAIFRRVGLPIPTGDVISQANDLAGALWQVLSSPPESAEDIPTAWSKEVEREPALAAYPRETVHRYLSRRVFGGGEERTLVAPHIDISPPSRRRSVEPFGPWLFSKEGLLAKGLLAAALMILFLTSAVAIRDARNAAARDVAFARIEAAIAAQDDVATIAAAEEFFNTPESRGDNERQAHAMGHYSEAIARWFLRRPGHPDEKTVARIANYQRISRSVQARER